MTLQFFCAVASSVIGIACFLPYIRDVLRHTTKPHSYSWLIWTLLQSIGAVAMLGAGAGIGVAPLVVGAGFCFSVWLLSLRYGTHNITSFDVVCLVGGLTAAAVYLFLHDPLLSVFIVALSDFVAFLPTLRKTYEEPDTETALTYVLSATSSFLAIGALMNVTLATSFYLVTLVVTNGACALIIFFRRRHLLAFARAVSRKSD